MKAALREIGETVRYALGNDARTARLAMLIVVFLIAWQVML